MSRDTTNSQAVHCECIMCSKIVTLYVNELDFYAWNEAGASIQEAFPYLTPDEREIMISSICGECFDGMYRIDDTIVTEKNDG